MNNYIIRDEDAMYFMGVISALVGSIILVAIFATLAQSRVLSNLELKALAENECHAELVNAHLAREEIITVSIEKGIRANCKNPARNGSREDLNRQLKAMQ